MQQAEQADRSEEDDGQKLPDEIARRQSLREKMQQARRELEARARQRAEAERAEYERKLAEREQREGRSKGPRPKPPDSTPRPEQQVNLSDPDSGLMRKSKRSSYTQSYNAQAVVDAQPASEGGSMLILGGHVTRCASDANELIPALQSVPEEIGKPTAVLADTGYANVEAIQQLQQDVRSPEPYVAVGRDDNQDRRRYDDRPGSATHKPAKKVTDPTLVAMKQKLQTDEGRAVYAQRKQTVEPVFGIIKHVIGFTRFSLRGHAKVSGEWSLVRLAYNVKRLWALQTAG